MSRFLFPIGAVALASFALWVFWARPGVERARQVRSYADLQVAQERLEDFFEKNGAYPSDLRTAVEAGAIVREEDGWGNRLLFLSEEDGFLLISLGRDGSPQTGVNYLSARNEVQSEWPLAQCQDLDTDQILSERGFSVACGE